MTKTCPSCSPPDWATNVSETKSWVCLQGQHLRWHWRLWGGAIWCVDRGPARGAVVICSDSDFPQQPVTCYSEHCGTDVAVLSEGSGYVEILQNTSWICA